MKIIVLTRNWDPFQWDSWWELAQFRVFSPGKWICVCSTPNQEQILLIKGEPRRSGDKGAQIPAGSLFHTEFCVNRDFRAEMEEIVLLGAAQGLWVSLWAGENKESELEVLGLSLPFKWEVMEFHHLNEKLFKPGLWEGRSGLSKNLSVFPCASLGKKPLIFKIKKWGLFFSHNKPPWFFIPQLGASKIWVF